MAERNQTRMLLDTNGAWHTTMTPQVRVRMQADLDTEEKLVARSAAVWRAAGGHPDLLERAEAMRAKADALSGEADRLRGGTGASVRYVNEDARQRMGEILPGISRATLATVVGAPRGGLVYVAPSQGRLLRFQVVGPGMRASHWIERMGSLVTLHTDIIHNEPGRRTAESGKAILRALQAMPKAGISRVVARAAAGADYTGYRTWALAGATGPIPARLLPAARAALGPSVHNVEDLMQSAKGRAWWRQHGDSWDATFDFSNPYTRERIADLARSMKS